MKKYFLIASAFLVVMIVIVMLFGKTTIKLNLGYDRKPFSHSQFMTKHYNSEDLLLVSVWATWCKPCIEEFPVLEQIQKDNKGLRVVSISIDDDTVRLKNFLKKNSALQLRDVTLKNIDFRDSIYSKIKLVDHIVDNPIVKINAKPIPYLVLIKNKKILYQAHEDLQIEVLQKLIKANLPD